MISNLATVMEVLMISALVVGLVVVVLLYRSRSTAAAWLVLAGLLLMIAVSRSPWPSRYRSTA
jgi:hypothetical protein